MFFLFTIVIGNGSILHTSARRGGEERALTAALVSGINHLQILETGCRIQFLGSERTASLISAMNGRHEMEFRLCDFYKLSMRARRRGCRRVHSVSMLDAGD